MTPTDPPSRPVPPRDPQAPTDAPKGAGRRPATGGGPKYRHPIEAPEFGEPHDEFHRNTLVHYDHHDGENPDVGHEHSDVNIRPLFMSAVALLIVTVAAHVIIYFLFGFLESEAASNQAQLSPVARPATEMPRSTTASPAFNAGSATPGPQLLTNEPMALEQQRAEEQKRLQGFGWVNQSAGVAHISIDQAKKLIVERGLPVRADAPVPPLLGTRLPAAGEASGGRVITVPLPEPPAGAPAQQAPKPHGH